MAPVPGTMIHSILDRTIHFLQDPVNQKRIHNDCIDPLLRHILDRMFPYIILICIIFSIILLMSLSTVGLLIFQLRNSMVLTIGAATSAATGVASGVATGAANLAEIIQPPV